MSDTFAHGGHTYKIGKLDAMRQFHMVRRLAGVLGGLGQAATPKGPQPDVSAILGPLAKGVASLSDADSEYVLGACLGVVERKQAAGGYAKVWSGGGLMFEDIELGTMLALTMEVLRVNLSGFFAGLPQASTAGGPM